jgi:hypothetical protein
MNVNPTAITGPISNTVSSSLQFPAVTHFRATPPKQSQAPNLISAMQLIRDMEKLSLHEQHAHLRIDVEIGGAKTLWDREFSAGFPYLQFNRDDTRLLLVWNAKRSALHMFKSWAAKAPFWPVEVITDPAAVFARLPREAFVPGTTAVPATFMQIVTLRKLLRLDPNAAIPDLHRAMASRIIAMIVTDPIVNRVMAVVAGQGGTATRPQLQAGAA